MGWVVLIAVIVGVIVLIAIAPKSAPSPAELEYRKRISDEQETYDMKRSELFEDNLAGYELIHCRMPTSQALLGLSGEENNLVVVSYQDHPLQRNFNVHEIATIDFESITRVELFTPERSGQITKRIITPVAVNKRKSAIVRGAVGGALLGPAGLLLGAASALTSEQEIKNVATINKEVGVIRGKPTISIYVDDHLHPINLEFTSDSEAKAVEQWLGHRIKNV